MKEIVVAQEHHTVEGLHLHAYVRLATRYTARGEHTSLHLKHPETGETHKPNVQGTKNKLAWVRYLHKEDPKPYSEGIDAAQYVQARESKTRILGKRLMEGEDLAALCKEPGFEHFLP